MKLQLDTDKKTIKIDESVKLTKLMQVVKKLLPNGEWQDFTLVTNTTIQQWTNPIIYKEYHSTLPYWWQQPWYNPVYPTYVGVGINSGSGITGGNVSMSLNSTMGTGHSQNLSNNAVFELKSGVYNVQV